MGLNNGRVFNLATMTLEQLKQDLLTEWEREVRGASDRMLPQDKAAFMALSNSHLHDGTGPILGILR